MRKTLSLPNWVPCRTIILLTFASNLSQEISLVVENFDAVCSVVANEDLLPVVDDNTIRELQVFGATELVKNISHLIEDDNTHDLQHYNLIHWRKMVTI